MNILRPLSPHLPIYKPQLTSTFPISHRISGAFLATLVLFFYLLCLKIGLICFTHESFYRFLFYSSKLILISVEITALALSYHLYKGVHHLLTDFLSFRKRERKTNWWWLIALFFKAYARLLAFYLHLPDQDPVKKGFALFGMSSQRLDPGTSLVEWRLL